jgi:hypothetical protein
MTDYTSVHAKLERAEKHLADFEEVLGAWIGSKPLSLEGTRWAPSFWGRSPKFRCPSNRGNSSHEGQ